MVMTAWRAIKAHLAHLKGRFNASVKTNPAANGKVTTVKFAPPSPRCDLEHMGNRVTPRGSTLKLKNPAMQHNGTTHVTFTLVVCGRKRSNNNHDNNNINNNKKPNLGFGNNNQDVTLTSAYYKDFFLK